MIHIQHIFVWGPRDSNEQRLLLTTTTVMHLYKEGTNTEERGAAASE